jgi:diacylglycerol kinase (ATP)
MAKRLSGGLSNGICQPPPRGAVQWARTLGRAAAGRTERSPFVEMTQGRVIDVKFGEALAYELDGGERGFSKRLQATVMPAALTFCVPEE